MNARAFVAFALIALAFYLASEALFVVGEGQQALVVRLGAPVASIPKPGLNFKAPLIDTVLLYDTRLLILDAPPEQVILGDQKRLEVKPFARFRIVDPLAFSQALRTVEAAQAELNQLVGSAVRRELGQVSLSRLLTNERTKIVEAIRDEVRARAAPQGLAIDEVRLQRADLPVETSQSIYERMKSEREREAREVRAQGFEAAQGIQAEADHKRDVIMSEAREEAAALRGEGEAEASRRLAKAFDADAKFYQFYRATQSYKSALARPGTTLVVSPDARFLELLLKGPGPRN